MTTHRTVRPLLAALILLPCLAAPARAARGIPAPKVEKIGRGKARFNLIWLGGWGSNAGRPWFIDGVKASFNLIRVHSNYRQDQLMSTQMDALADAVQNHLPDPALPLHIAGHSMGGKGTIWAMSDARIRDKVTTGLPIAPFLARLHVRWKQAGFARHEGGLPPMQRAVEQLTELKRGVDAGDKGAADRWDRLTRASPRGFELDLARLGEREHEGWARIEKPMLVVHGTKDTGISVNYAEKFARANPGATLVPVSGAGHEGGPQEMIAREAELLWRTHTPGYFRWSLRTLILRHQVKKQRKALAARLEAERLENPKISETLQVPAL